jgi:hypothetical protein|nr:MAG TPA: hypothetical protein [Caudoviricetes sp.]
MKYEVNFEIYGKIDVTAKDMDDAINIVREMDRCDLFKGAKQVYLSAYSWDFDEEDADEDSEAASRGTESPRGA